MDECSDIIARLTDRNVAAACALTERIVSESRDSGCWYMYLDSFIALLRHKNSLVRNRAIAILAANARWDTENRYEKLMDQFLLHITDEKPITARQCIKALPDIAAAKPELLLRIKKALEGAELAGYNDSMRPLLLKDITNVLKQLNEKAPASN